MQMFALMEKNYVGLLFDSFIEDLKQKDSIFLFHSNRTIYGFTGLKLFPFHFEDQDLLIAYSGDTVLDESFRGTLSIPVYWGIFMLKLSEKHPNLYWLLTSKGFRTYRYLSVFFKDFIPMPTQTNQFLVRLRDQVANKFFPNLYNPNLGILNRGENSQTIRDIVTDRNVMRISKDPFIKFFEKTNPDFDKGHELVCLAHFHPSNIHQYILRILNDKSNV
ncbi:hypothetical protein CH372_08575 [Leptospira meyeri]|uniref:hypothetical protein n=2 Tax=Leptospira meyeri TaxID=29508 RepID=UPI000C2A851C|nr:hypothetical protein [Leptospira meyeri]PJZ95178.1 hypothetical protein CH358_18185 [Leptospira meyeri]PKA12514.1 hypothetical protein CH372_08575 [Leptospira meyeri]TGM17440.1 hypothetical protein EHQ73_18930 [Leptospira meyeri]TGM63128.1 hypothetical protein EHQ93_10625 [Leptospira meyeri]TGM73922.1 hypothetical protein EHQ94_00160 [Leptospira meyeri]